VGRGGGGGGGGGGEGGGGGGGVGGGVVGQQAVGEGGGGGVTSEYSLTVFVDGPSTRYIPKRMVQRRESSVETLIAWIKWLLMFV